MAGWKPNVCLLGVIMAAGAAPMAAQEFVESLDAQRGVSTNRYTSAEDIEGGARFFRSRCVGCHGQSGQGGRGPDLTRGVFRHGSSDRALFLNILGGIPGTGMPAVRGPDRVMWQVVSYVRSLSEVAKPDNIPGDPLKGAELFREKGGCDECHWVNGRGGRFGPDLTGVGWIRSPEHLRTSIVDPNKDIEDDYRSVRVTDRDGREAQGILLDEDTFSIQLLDSQERLRSFAKADVRDLARLEFSMMPSYDRRFSQDELDDLVAYLASLRRR